MVVYEDIVKYYEFFYRRKYGNEKYKFAPSIKADREIHNLLSKLNDKYNLDTIGDNFLSRYFSFQFNRVEGQVFKRFAGKDVGGKIQIYDIIGRKAYEYFEKRNTKFDFIIQIPINIVKKNSQYKQSNIAEEIERKRFFNTPRGIVHCLERTSLYNHKSPNCILCIHKIPCKELLKVNYKQIYEDRGYGKTIK